MLDRAEEVTAGGNRPSAYGKVKIAGTKDGTITAFEVDCYGSPGVGNGSDRSMCNALPYVYPIPEQDASTRSSGSTRRRQRAMRAPGHPQSCFLTDSAVDDLAAKLGHGPAGSAAEEPAARTTPRP